MTTTATQIIRYRVTLDTPKGLLDVDLGSGLGSQAAGRRAWLALVQKRIYGDVDQVRVISVQELCGYAMSCERVASGHVWTVFPGWEIPICQEHQDFVDRMAQ